MKESKQSQRLRAKIQREFDAEPPPMATRPGIHYAWYNAYNLDGAILAKRKFAKEWRGRVLGLPAGELALRRVRVRSRYAGPNTADVVYSVYSVNGKDRYAVATCKSNNYIYREVTLPEGKLRTFEAWAEDHEFRLLSDRKPRKTRR